MRAWVMIRDRPHYRSESFCRGLVRHGYSAIMTTQLTAKMVKPDDIVIVWNAYGRYGAARDLADQAGLRTFVAENGYLGNDKHGRQFYALAEHGHTGSGRWRVGGRSRLEGLLLSQRRAMASWRTEGEHILVCAQRGIGEAKMRSPGGWEQAVQKIIRKTTGRPIKVRLHPGRHDLKTTLEEDMKGAWAAVVWSSNCATDLLLAGIPVFYAAPHIVHQGGALPLTGANFSDPAFGNRERAFNNIAWAQWSVGELEKGTPWKFLLPESDPAGTEWIGGYRP